MRRILLLVLIALFIGGCCMGHPDVEKALKDGIAVNAGHMADKDLPEEAHAVAQDNFVFLNQILYALTGDPVPDDVQKIIDARKGGDTK